MPTLSYSVSQANWLRLFNSLKYYKIDSEGKIKRLRRECPTAECGAGAFVRIIYHQLAPLRTC